jgi:hypothetical protein
LWGEEETENHATYLALVAESREGTPELLPTATWREVGVWMSTGIPTLAGVAYENGVAGALETIDGVGAAPEMYPRSTFVPA